uniref:ribosomal protein S19 n=1 Tax=Prototheca tumulicola TaxID=1737639 RepID=UPI00300359DC
MKLKKNLFIAYHIISKIQKKERDIKLKTPLTYRFFRTWSRSSTIYPFMAGYTIAVYNGNRFIPVVITSKMLGEKLGAFSPTRNFEGHSKKKKGKKTKKK